MSPAVDDMDVKIRGAKASAALAPPHGHVPRFGKSHIEISIPQDAADEHAYPPEAVQVRNTFIHVASPGQGATEEIAKNALSCPASHVGWIQKLFTEDDEVPKAAKPVISLEETLIFDVPNTPHEEPLAASTYANRDHGKQWLATQPPQQPMPPVHDAGLCPPRPTVPCEPPPGCYAGADEAYLPYRMYEEPWMQAPAPLPPMHDPQMCPPPHPVPCEANPQFYHPPPEQPHAHAPPMPLPPIPCEAAHGFYPHPPLHDPHLCPPPHPVPCEPTPGFYPPPEAHAHPVPMPCEPPHGFYHAPPPEEARRPLLPVPCEPRSGFYHPPPEDPRAPLMPVPCEPRPGFYHPAPGGFYHPPPLPPCEPGAGYYHPPPEEPRSQMMPHPCEPNPQYYRQAHEEDLAGRAQFKPVEKGEEVGPKRSVEDLPTLLACKESKECRPCAFLYAKGCQNGAMCLFCHLCDKGEKKRRQKAKKASFQGGA
ncbi:hypothetical protein AK812_SmicGene1688 [Symbiodinium microadriaticum]|uniref:C3H1-type domain-containing protein n=1 Tax=Symbiodinium microadriaticum TaxID=2951 RepID=A0A1Q9F3F6_SYMMI|nr:hypothetical protein AK812_SmicGene1688 [Symbiodinium microadriaticum]